MVTSRVSRVQIPQCPLMKIVIDTNKLDDNILNTKKILEDLINDGVSRDALLYYVNQYVSRSLYNFPDEIRCGIQRVE